MGRRGAASGDAVYDLLVATPRVFFKLKAIGQRVGAVNRWGGGTWGMLRSLHVDGPQTVPRLARSRPVARQRIQKLADELAEAGLVRYVENPAHRRSKLVRLTAKGEAAFLAVDARIRAWARDLAPAFGADEVAAATAVLDRLAERLDAALATEPTAPPPRR